MPKKSHRRSHTRKILVAVLVLLAVIAGLVFYKIHQDDAKKVTLQPVVGTKSTQASAPSKTSVPSTAATSQGGVVDNNGKTSGTLPSSSLWTTSSSGLITLQQPTSGATVSSGDTISGLAQVSQVQFILTDSSVGLIAQGNLNVVSGKFSGTLQFTPHSTSGTLEVYYPNPQTGAEEDIVNIPVKFNTSN